MIRVGFLYPRTGDAWLGGSSYLRNLLGALAAAPELGVHPVLLAEAGARVPAGFDEVEIIRSVAVSVHHLLVLRAMAAVLRRDPFLDRILGYHRLEVLSHSGVLGSRARTPTIAWIPDFQHRALPTFFPRSELAGRDAAFSRFLREAALVIVSSEAARKDAERFFPGHAEKIRVLRFVDGSAAAAAATPLDALQARYGFAGRFFALPNQYWAHKNHQVVLDALALLRDRGREVLVLSTGNASDYRSPGYFKGFQQRRAALGLEGSYRILGVVPFVDLAGLLRHSVAVLNPSLFEGWSTTVEEAKSLGKRVLLSDIAVHREQAPERGTYFDPRQPEQLAEAMWAAWTADDAGEEGAMARAAVLLRERRKEFAQTYAAIVREAVAARS